MKLDPDTVGYLLRQAAKRQDGSVASLATQRERERVLLPGVEGGLSFARQSPVARRAPGDWGEGNCTFPLYPNTRNDSAKSSVNGHDLHGYKPLIDRHNDDKLTVRGNGKRGIGGKGTTPGELNDPILIGKYAHNILPSNEIILGHAAAADAASSRLVESG